MVLGALSSRGLLDSPVGMPSKQVAIKPKGWTMTEEIFEV